MVMLGPVWSCEDRCGHVRTGVVMLGPVWSCEDRCGHVYHVLYR